MLFGIIIVIVAILVAYLLNKSKIIESVGKVEEPVAPTTWVGKEAQAQAQPIVAEFVPEPVKEAPKAEKPQAEKPQAVKPQAPKQPKPRKEEYKKPKGNVQVHPKANVNKKPKQKSK